MNYTKPDSAAERRAKFPSEWPVGQLVLVKTDGFVSGAIRLFQTFAKEGTAADKRWNHVAIMIDEETCLGAEPGGARTYPVTDFPDRHISRIPYTDAQRSQVVHYALDQKGAPYSYLDIGLIAFALYTRTETPAWLADKLSADDRFICSELGDAAVTSAGIPLVRDGRAFSAVYPSSISYWLKKDGWW